GSLSCVATHPAMRGRGLGARAVKAASDWLRDAGWEAADVVLLANGDENALRSDMLGKAVVLELLSGRAQAAAASFQGAEINLDLPPGEFI
ncbi:hypothetical protein VL04_22140, partial [Chromobacterium violaceum]|uniref:GNAT family N-acetyltransferase n=1 Tax=Chromobacterium violaceum TaxID=536 RepID=UPI00065432EB